MIQINIFKTTQLIIFSFIAFGACVSSGFATDIPTPSSVHITTQSEAARQFMGGLEHIKNPPKPIQSGPFAPGAHLVGPISNASVDLSATPSRLQSPLESSATPPIIHNPFAMAAELELPNPLAATVEGQSTLYQIRCPDPGCERVFQTKLPIPDGSELTDHILKHKLPSHKCRDCPDSKPSQAFSSFRRHLNTHDPSNGVPCSLCGKRFSTPSNLKTHSRTHSGERPYPCNFPGCKKRFAQQTTLDNHERTHTGEKPFPCKMCDRAFKQQATLSTHMSSVHAVGATEKKRKPSTRTVQQEPSKRRKTSSPEKPPATLRETVTAALKKL